MGAAHKLDVALRDVGAVPNKRPYLHVEETFAAYAVLSQNGLRGKKGEARLIDRHDIFRDQPARQHHFDSFDDAVEHGLLATQHKGTFFVRCENQEAGKVTLHFFVVKQKSCATPVYRDYQTRMIRQMYAEPLHDLVLDAALMPARTSQEQPQ